MRTDDQLRQLFNETFDALPREVRSKLEDFWSSRHIPHEDVGEKKRFFPPIIQKAHLRNHNQQQRGNPLLQDTLSRATEELEFALRSRSICAQTDSLIFRFKRVVVNEAPENMLKVLIAHELGHAFRAAEVGLPFPEAGLILGTDERAEEDAVTGLLERWGFNQNRLLAWLYENSAKLMI